MKLLKLTYHTVLVSLAVGITGCEGYLSAKPDKKMTEPLSMDDCDALLDNNADMSLSYPAVGEAASDDYYLTSSNWEALTIQEDRLNYYWDAGHTALLTQWQAPYKTVMQANQVIELLENLDRETDPARYDRIRGTALFFRAYAFYALSQVFAPPYEAGKAHQLPGIPIRLKSNIGYSTGRGTLQQTYDQILADINKAISLLPEYVAAKTRPGKTAAYAALARTHLSMQNYAEAARAASSALERQNDLLDYNDLNVNATVPFTRFHAEIIFHAGSAGNSALNPSRAYIDSNLYVQYQEYDLRKAIFFRRNSNSTYSFKGKYDGQNNAAPFTGIATDEIWLIRAECHVRTGNLAEGISDLNQLLKHRWDPDYFVPFTTDNADEALAHILRERRKELPYRNLRWSDLRRLNMEPHFAKTLVRVLNGQHYELPPNDLRYTLLIPQEVMLNSNLTQNPR